MTVITVTAEHIAKGIRGNCEHCPVALALLDAYPDLTYISVGPDAITMQHGKDTAEIEVTAPCEVEYFICDFDEGAAVAPFTFALDYPAVTR